MVTNILISDIDLPANRRPTRRIIHQTAEKRRDLLIDTDMLPDINANDGCMSYVR